MRRSMTGLLRRPTSSLNDMALHHLVMRRWVSGPVSYSLKQHDFLSLILVSEHCQPILLRTSEPQDGLVQLSLRLVRLCGIFTELQLMPCSSIISLAAQLVGYLTPSLVGASVAYAVVGLVYGPLYPNVLMVIAEQLDEDLRVGIISFMGVVSGLGGAILPMYVSSVLFCTLC